MKKHYLLSALLTLTLFKVIAQPPAAPTAPPTRSAANVISIYGGAYTNRTGVDFNPNWGQTGFASASEITVGTEKIRKYANLNYQGIDFGGGINLASIDSVHFDIWTPDCTKLDIYLIDAPADHEKFVTVNLALSGWNNVTIPLNKYSSQGVTLNNIIQFKLVSNTPATGTNIYLDNIYFFTNQSLPTLSNFTVPTNKVATDVPFMLTAPTSNSTGAFTYTSGNTNVATVSGTTVTLVSSGSAIITATQAAAGSYSSGTITATLNVGYAPPTIAAPTPTVAAANVIPLLSSYAPYMPNRTINTWGTSWQSAVTVDTIIATTRTIKYYNLIYSGTEFTGANSINATAMNFFHVDVWTPNSSAIGLKLVDFGADNAYGGGDDKSSQIVLDANPKTNQWNSYNIPLSAFSTSGLDTRANLSQLLFTGSNTTIFVENVYFSKLTTLPVNLSEFVAAKKASTVVLSWKTLSEINNKGFAVERSNDATNWNQLQFITGNGSTTTTNQYSLTDNSPLSGVNYYRLKQIDNDGKQAYSSIVSVNFSNTDALGFSFYPNPVNNKVVVALQTIQANTASLSLVNTDGKIVKTVVLTNQNSNTTVQIDITNLARGNYFLVLKDGTAIKTSKVLIN